MADLHPSGKRRAGHRGVASTQSAREAEIKQWLKRATDGLPKDLRAEVTEELRAHYQDALADYTYLGSTTEEAHRAALKDLGADEHVAQGFRSVHFAARYYVGGLFASLLYPVCYVGFLALLVFAGYHPVMEAIYYLVGILLSTLAVFYCFHRLLHNQIVFTEETHFVDESLVVFGVGIICSMLIGFTSWMLLGTDISVVPWAGFVSIPNLLEQILFFITDLGSLLVGIALLILGGSLAFRKSLRIRLIRALGILMLVLGGVIIWNTLNYTFDIQPNLIWYLSVVTEGLHLTICGLLIVIFTQALWRERSSSSLRLT